IEPRRRPSPPDSRRERGAVPSRRTASHAARRHRSGDRADRPATGSELMADVEVVVAGRHYKLSCRDGEEDHLHRLVGMVEAKADQLTRALGDMTEPRTLLLSALLLAD